MKVLATVFIFCLSLSAQAEIWGVEHKYYRGTGIWEDNLEQKGKLVISFVTEVKGEEESFWLVLNYRGIKRRIYASRIWDNGSPFKIFSIYGWPIGDGKFSLCDWCPGEEEAIEFTYDIHLSEWTLKLLRLSSFSSGSGKDALSGSITEKGGKTVKWDYIELEKVDG